MLLDLFVNNMAVILLLRTSQPIGVMSNAINLPNHTFTGQT